MLDSSALQKLLADVRSGKIDFSVVYKVDRSALWDELRDLESYGLCL